MKKKRIKPADLIKLLDRHNLQKKGDMMNVKKIKLKKPEDAAQYVQNMCLRIAVYNLQVTGFYKCTIGSQKVWFQIV